MEQSEPQESPLVEIKVQIARIDERLKGMCEKQDCIHGNLQTIIKKLDGHSKSIEKYKYDRSAVVWIFGLLYSGMLAWIEYRSK